MKIQNNKFLAVVTRYFKRADPSLPRGIVDVLNERLLINFYVILGELCDADYDAISKWSFDLTIDDESLLTESGRTEMKELGQRYKARLPEIFDETYNEDNIIVFLIYLT